VNNESGFVNLLINLITSSIIILKYAESFVSKNKSNPIFLKAITNFPVDMAPTFKPITSLIATGTAKAV
jgi:hypothetical protein